MRLIIICYSKEIVCKEGKHMYSKQNNRNYQRQSNASYGKSNRRNTSTGMGAQNFQNMVSQLNQINQIIVENKKNNPMELLNHFLYNKPK